MAIQAKSYGIIRCLFCGDRSAHLVMYRTECEQHPITYDGFMMFFERSYRCNNCMAEFNLRSKVDTLDNQELLREDELWAEKLNQNS